MVEEKKLDDLILRLYHANDSGSANMLTFHESYESRGNIQEVMKDRFVNSKKAHELIGREITQMRANDHRQWKPNKFRTGGCNCDRTELGYSIIREEYFKRYEMKYLGKDKDGNPEKKGEDSD